MIASLSALRNECLRDVERGSRVLADAEVSFYRLAVRALQSNKPKDYERASRAKDLARYFGELFDDQLADLDGLGLSRCGFELSESATNRIEAGRMAIEVREAEAGRTVPYVPPAWNAWRVLARGQVKEDEVGKGEAETKAEDLARHDAGEC